MKRILVVTCRLRLLNQTLFLLSMKVYLAMFKEMSQLFGMMRNSGKIKEEMDKLQQRLSQIVAEGDAGAGMVKVKANGKMEIVGCRISEEAMKLNDREMLEDMIRAATNQAMTKVRHEVMEETSKIGMSLGLPPGVSLPGIG